MKRISLVALAAILFAAWTPPANATGFEPLGVDGLRRITGFGFGQGYHSYPKNPALRQAYQQAQCRQLPIQPAPAYPCSPRAPEAHRGCGTCNGVAQQGMVQHAAPQMIMGPINSMGSEMYSPANTNAEDHQHGKEHGKSEWNTDETKSDWQAIPESNQKKQSPKVDPAEDSPQREKLPTPEPDEKVELPGEDMLDELESYFGDNVGPSPQTRQQSQIRRLPPTTTKAQTSAEPPSTNVYIDPAGPPKPKKSDIWW